MSTCNGAYCAGARLVPTKIKNETTTVCATNIIHILLLLLILLYVASL